ncbi:DNA polymerase III subunit gamma/tau [Thermovibrio ammonificans]
MAYLAIPRKYRPQRFDQVVGQDFITKTLKNAIKSGRFAHAYIFAGPRGVGKTTTARIVAKALNCENPTDGEPCNSCPQCLEISKGAHPDVIEVDAATNRGIDQIRELRESVHYAPARGKRKVYIIDEFHMLTKEAFNALLKTLEEPPEHAVFILATTEIDKIPPTILSRCQKFLFRKVPRELIVETLERICRSEGVEFDREALELIAVASEGCIRDAESLLDQAIALGGGRVDSKVVSEFLGVLTGRELRNLLQTAFKGDKAELRTQVKRLEELGYNPLFVVKQLLSWLEEELFRTTTFSEEEVNAAFQLLSECYRSLQNHPQPYTALLFYLFRLSYFKDVKRLSELLSGGISLTVPAQSPEKKTAHDPLNSLIHSVKDLGNLVEVTAKSEIAYRMLNEQLALLRERFKKEVKLLPPSKRERPKRELSPESNDKIDLMVRLLNAKVISVRPKERDENSDS